MPFHRELFITIAALFLLFVTAILIFQYSMEKEHRKELLNSTLQEYNDLIHKRIYNDTITFSQKSLDSIVHYITDKKLRVTILSAKTGEILMDNHESELSNKESHLSRPEIIQAIEKGSGYALRRSSSLNQSFFYSAKSYDNYLIIIRSSLPFDIHIDSILNVDIGFFYFLIISSVITILILFYFCHKLGNSVSILKHFSKQAEQGFQLDTGIQPDKSDIGDVTRNLIRIYNNLRTTKEELSIEKEKLFKHLQFSKEGLAIFSADKKVIVANNLFVQYLNLITDTTIKNVESFFEEKEFYKIHEFVNKRRNARHIGEEFIADSIFLTKNGKTFQVECIIFQDHTFEIAINDITFQEKETQLKKQLTQNIAHELKTPVSSIQGYMETILSNPFLSEEKRSLFMQRCYAQTIRLAGLLRDISMLNRLDESNDLFDCAVVSLDKLVDDIFNESATQLAEHHMTAISRIPEETNICGNYSLLYSIFRNLTDNAISYAGDGSQVLVECYYKDDEYYYLSFSDTGTGVSQEHLNRLFERFYRVDKGRSRKLGGTGLGLAIVKNAVLFHKGEIMVKNGANGGLNFLFTLKRNQDSQLSY